MRPPHLLASLVPLAALYCAWAADLPRRSDAQPGTVFVKTALGGFILGYDIDQNGTEGVLSEARSLSGGAYAVAVETFDQATGQIVKIVARQTNTQNDFVKGLSKNKCINSGAEACSSNRHGKHPS